MQNYECPSEQLHGIGMVGLNFRAAPIHIREAIAKSLADEESTTHFNLPRGSLLLNTCHRIEVYYDSNDNPAANANTVTDYLARHGNMAPKQLEPFLSIHEGADTVSHIIEVASGLQSMTLGEGQILTQVRQAPENSTTLEVSPRLKRLFQIAVKTGKLVRTKTRVGRANASLAAAAIAKLLNENVSLRQKNVLVIGNGRMAQLVMKQALDGQVAHLQVACRRPEEARQSLAFLQSNLGPDAALEITPLESIEAALAKTDVVFAATGAPSPVIPASTLLASVQSPQRRQPLWVIDLAMPRDVEPPDEIPDNLRLLTVDDLAPKDEQAAAADLDEAYEITRRGKEEFMEWLGTLPNIPILQTMREDAERIRTEELERLINQLGFLNDDQRQKLDAYSRRLTNKVLHFPTMVIKKGKQGCSKCHPPR